MTTTSHLSISKDLSSDHFCFVEKRGPDWGSDYRTTPNAIEGSPMLFWRAYGEQIARFFGYELLDENNLRIPRARFVNQQAQELNAQLDPEYQITLRFYETHNEPQTPAQYLQRFVDSCEMPIASEGSVAIHDTSYHFGAIFLPDIALAASLSQAELLLKFIDFVRPKNILSETQIETLLFEMALNIDSGTGNFTNFLAQSSPPKISANWILSRNGLNAARYLQWFVPIVLRKAWPDLDLSQELKEFSQNNIGALHRINLGPSEVAFEKAARDKIAAIQKAIVLT